MKIEALLAKLDALRPALEAEGVQHLALFGSRARGDFSAASDVDILIDVLPAAGFSILNLAGVERLIADATGMSANAFMRRSLDAPFRDSISRETIEIF